MAAIGLSLGLTPGCGLEPTFSAPVETGVVLTAGLGGSTGSSSGGAGGTGSTSTTGGVGEDSTAGEATAPPVRLDGGIPDGGEPVVGCKGKIDFLFVVSAEGTMEWHQKQLVAAFPEFMAAIEAKLEGFDVHILVTNGAPGWKMEDCSWCADPADCDPLASPPGCGATVDKCDQQFGAGITFPAAEGASNRRCDLYGGNRYIISGEPDLAAAFSCIATVGLDTYDAVPVDSAFAALDPKINTPPFCNGGFLRDDALLVVTLIHDTYDESSQGYPTQWAAKFVEVKHGNPDALMVLALSTDIDQLEHLCLPDEQPHLEYPNQLRRLTQKVKHGRFGSICMPDFGPFFADAVDEMVELCDNLIPQ